MNFLSNDKCIRAHFRVCPIAFLNVVIKRSTVENEASQLNVEVTNISPVYNNIYIYIYIYINLKNYFGS